MANFKDSPKFSNYDDYYTSEKTWNQLYILRNDIAKIHENEKPILEACCMNSPLSHSPKYLRKALNHKVKRNTKDILLRENEEMKEKYSMIITNPPFTNPLKQKIIEKLLDIDLPFIIILNSTNIFTKWFRETLQSKDDDYRKRLQIITPKGKLTYHKAYKNEEDEWELEEKTKDPSFYSVFVAWDCNIPNERLFL